MRIKTIVFITAILIIQISFSISQEVKFEAKKIDTNASNSNAQIK